MAVYVRRYLTIAGFICIPMTTINMLIASEKRTSDKSDLIRISNILSKTIFYSGTFPYFGYKIYLRNDNFMKDFTNPEKNIMDMLRNK